MDIGIDRQIRCIEDELQRREKFYPHLIEAEKLSKENAENQIITMRRVLSTLVRLKNLME